MAALPGSGNFPNGVLGFGVYLAVVSRLVNMYQSILLASQA